MIKNNRFTNRKGALIVLGVVVVLIAGTMLALEATNTTYLFHKKEISHSKTSTPTVGGASENSQKGEPQSSATQSVDANKPQPGDTKSNTSGVATDKVVTPFGDFVSNHHPNLSGTPAPNTISSVCTTTPGATCVITFTNNGVIKSLGAQTTDRGGSTYWNWKLQDIGLTSGSWQIQATATLNGVTKTASDVLSLEVAP